MSDERSASYYEERIKSMSRLLSNVTKQVTVPSAGPAESPESLAFYHIATLLTRGSNDGGYARDVIAVTGVQRLLDADAASELLDSDKSTTPSSPDINSCLVKIHITITQNQGLRSSADHTVIPVHPSQTPILVTLSTIDTNTSTSLEQHAADIFGALASTSKLHRIKDRERYIVASYLALSLIIGRSFPKISRRVEASRYLFKPNFLEILINEELKLSGKLEVTRPKQVQVFQADGDCYVEVGTRLEAAFVSNEVPCITRDGIVYFLFHTSSAMLWIKALVSVYKSVKASTRERPVAVEEWHALQIQLEQLHRMVYVLGEYYDAILSLPGLVNFFRNNLQVEYAVNDLYGSPQLNDGDKSAEDGDKSAEDGNESDEDDYDSDEDSRADTLSDIGVDDREPASKIFMRYLRAIAAWNQAYLWLDSSKVFRSPKGILSLHFVKMRVPIQQNQAATSIMALLEEFLKTTNFDENVEKRIKNLKPSKNKFGGTIHAEAALMALIKESSNAETTLPQSLVDILKDANAIGIAKKCCWLCKQLGEVMKDHGQPFSLPGTSGIIFSWAPPTGLDITVLREVENRLKEQLFGYLTKYATEKLQETQSHQSSPITSFMDISLPGSIADETALDLRRIARQLLHV